jgi:hypothetical protein
MPSIIITNLSQNTFSPVFGGMALKFDLIELLYSKLITDY